MTPEPQNPTVPLVLSLVACFVFALGIIIAGYFHGNMHLITTLKNAAH